MSTQQNLKRINLKDNERKALQELKERLLKKYPEVEIILYGSKARGDSDEESDIDLLILVESLINTKLEEEIFHISYQIELKFEVIFG
ncbi:MAG: nucleotidyltransferase domain-containing protein, partial [Candidatus Humimicrobiaceae bacterium]